MCGRYTAVKSFEALAKRAGAFRRGVLYVPRYNIAPTQMAPVIFREESQTAVKQMRWGLIPSWSKAGYTGKVLVNARVETLTTQLAFREPFKRRRCLVPADGFYEWQERSGQRQPFRVVLRSGEPFCFAGLWDRWIRPPALEAYGPFVASHPVVKTIDSFTIITQPASATIAPLHNRMPLMLAPAQFDAWLGEAGSDGEPHQTTLTNPLPDPLKIYPVGKLVNNARADGPPCIEPVVLEADFFEQPWWDYG